MDFNEAETQDSSRQEEISDTVPCLNISQIRDLVITCMFHMQTGLLAMLFLL